MSMASLTRSVRANDERRDEGEQRLLTAVEKLLAEGWAYTELPVSKIAEEAGMSRPSFYSYFPDKGKLLIRLTDRVYQSVAADVWPWWYGDHRGGPPEIAAALVKTITEYRNHFATLRAVLQVATYDDQVDQSYRARLGEYAAALAERISEQQAKGLMHPAVDAAMTAQFMMTVTERTIADHIAAGRTDDADLAEALGRSLWLMMYGDAKKPPAAIERR